MEGTNDQIDALVAAVLATYSYSLDKAWALRGAVRAAGLCDAEAVKGQAVEAVGNALKAAGYDRGGITYIIAPRVITLMTALSQGQLDGLAAHVRAGDRRAFGELLQSVKGFGPRSSELAWELMQES